MLVVADSSPINFLVRIECIDVLPGLFQTVSIPTTVLAELSDSRAPENVRSFVASPPPWLVVCAPTEIEHIPPLDPGEEAAISLARELHADALLIDEKDGRKAAAARGIVVIGTIGILEAAADRGMLDLTSALERLADAGFRMSPSLIDAALERHRRRIDRPE